MKRSALPLVLRSIRARADVADAKGFAGDGMDGGAVAGAVVRNQPLDADAVAAVKDNGAVEEADRSDGFLIGQDLGVGESAVVVDGDVDVFPADGVASFACCVDELAVVGRVALTSDSFTSP